MVWEGNVAQNATLIGLLIDVSASMTQSIGSNTGRVANRLESVRDTIRDVVSQLAQREVKSETDSTDLFALGFGFGNPLSVFLGRRGAPVRDLFHSPNSYGTVAARRLFADWSGQENHIRGLATQMFGATPMFAALEMALERFRAQKNKYEQGLWLVLISDGAPTDGTPQQILALANEMKALGVTIVSCFVASNDQVSYRRLFSEPQDEWSSEATLLHDCASQISSDEVRSYFSEIGWSVDQGGRLFAQANNSELIKELLNSLGSIGGSMEAPGDIGQVPPPDALPIDVFLSYAREDTHLAAEIAAKLQTLGISVWWDHQLHGGDRYIDTICERLLSCRAAIVIWSDHSINSDWVKYEAKKAHEQGKLIPLKTQTLNIDLIPPPYAAVLHTLAMEDNDSLISTLRSRGVA